MPPVWASSLDPRSTTAPLPDHRVAVRLSLVAAATAGRRQRAHGDEPDLSSMNSAGESSSSVTAAGGYPIQLVLRSHLNELR
jgi:hypothetical protein